MLRVLAISFIYFLIPYLFGLVSAQDEMRVERCSSVDQRTPIFNVYVDSENNKWVGTKSGLYLVKACDLAETVKLAEDEISILSFPNGNMDIRCNSKDLSRFLSTDNLLETVSSAFYVERTRQLWIGTFTGGLYQFSLNNGLRLIQHFDTGNSRMRSDQVNSIFVDKSGRIWVGTYDGVFVRNGNRWEVFEKYLNFQAITSNDHYTWLLADNFLWTVDARNRWSSVDVGTEMVEGMIKDISFDQAGNLWIASEALTRYSPSTGEFKIFDGADYYTSSFANCLATDRDGAVWVGTQDKGLYIIEKASAMTVNCIVQKGLSCDGKSDDAVVLVKITGGQPPYDYRWEDNNRDSRRENLAAGEYIITVTDAKGKSKSAKAIINNPKINTQIEIIQNADAETGEKGSARVVVTGGMPEYQYTWDNGETSMEAISLSAGLHQVTVTDQSGCQAVGEVTVPKEIAPLKAQLVIVSQNACAGDRNGALEVQINGGRAPYQLSWSDDRYSGMKLDSLSAGQYAITVTDEIGNTANTSILISDPEELEIDIEIISSANTNQSDGKAQVTASGGIGEYTYLWDTEETTASATRLSAGIHQVTVSDEAGCIKTGKIEMTEDILPLKVDLKQLAKNTCFGDKKATVQVEISGGKGPFNSQWNKGWDRPQGRAYLVQGLAAGDYLVTITDGVGNETIGEITIDHSDPLTSKIVVDQAAGVNAKDGKATIFAEGGNGNYTYQWSNSEVDTTASSLSAGQHYVTVTDQEGCSITDSVLIPENILPLTAEIEQIQEVKCQGDSTALIKAIIKGGKAPYKYHWNVSGATSLELESLNAGIYSLTVEDAVNNLAEVSVKIEEPQKLQGELIIEKAANVGMSDGSASVKISGGTGVYIVRWDNGESTATATNLDASIHGVTVTDEAGCSWVSEFTMSENILPLAIEIQQTGKIRCFGESTGALSVGVSGGKKPYTYIWNTGGSNASQLDNLASGEYQVSVTDALGSMISQSYSIPQPEVLIAQSTQLSPASANENNGKASVQASGGTAPYSYLWEGGSTDKLVDGLRPGSHRITVTDAVGCVTHSMVIINEDIKDLQVDMQITKDLLCAEDNDGTIVVDVKGGKSPYTYVWNDPSLEGNQLEGLGNGRFAVTVTDASQQSGSAEASLNRPDPIMAKVVDQRAATDKDTPDGSAKISASGGTGELSYTWDNGVNTLDNNGLTTGNHHLTITDQNGCKEILNVEIKKRYLPELVMSRLQDGQIIEMQQVQFNADSARLNLESIPILDELTNFLKDNPSIIIQVQGHTNNVPSHEFCDALSTARAKTVANYLTSKEISDKRVFYKGFGKRNPKYTNLTEEGRRKNQRVEIMIRKTN